MRILLVLAAGCYAPTVETGSPCDVTADCPADLVCSPATQTCERTATFPDAPVVETEPVADAPVAPICVGKGISVCIPPPTGTRRVTAAIDTSACELVVDGLCVIAAAELFVDGTVSVSGSRPLVLVGTTAITIGGTLDAASRRGGKLGPGAAVAPCALVPTSFSAGGAGGSFGGRGGEGGDGPDGNGVVSAPTTTAFVTLRAGCAGSTGGLPKPGAGGAGGGAVYLISGGIIAVPGTIDVAGAGGTGGATGDRGAGGGGGSGGFVGLDAPARSVTGRILINGGGGGEGGGSSSTGNPGTDGGAGGADASSNGGDGGDGATVSDPSGENGHDAGSDSSGGGGGGGGAGAIRVY